MEPVGSNGRVAEKALLLPSFPPGEMANAPNSGIFGKGTEVKEPPLCFSPHSCVLELQEKPNQHLMEKRSNTHITNNKKQGQQGDYGF